MIILSVKNLSKQYGHTTVLDRLDFEVEQGKVVSIVGPNGAGKSTLFDLWTGFTSPDRPHNKAEDINEGIGKTTIFDLVGGFVEAERGKIFFKGQDITRMSPEERAGLGISRTFQQIGLFKELTVLENLALVAPISGLGWWKRLFSVRVAEQVALEKVGHLLEKFGLSDRLNMPAGKLSTGQQRLLEIIRAVMLPHELLLLDEPTAGLNPVARERIAELLGELKGTNDTVVIIEHDMEFVRVVSDLVYRLEGGKLEKQNKKRRPSK